MPCSSAVWAAAEIAVLFSLSQEKVHPVRQIMHSSFSSTTTRPVAV